MYKLATLFLAAALVLASGCAKPVHVTWQAAGGSRADATIEVAYTYNPELEIPQQSEAQAQAEALKRCQAWGYADAEPFGLEKSQCVHMTYNPFAGPICTKYMVSRQFQCLGRGDSVPAIEPVK